MDQNDTVFEKQLFRKVPLIGGMVGDIWKSPKDGKDYKWYISGIFPANSGIIYHQSHPLREPGNSIDFSEPHPFFLDDPKYDDQKKSNSATFQIQLLQAFGSKDEDAEDLAGGWTNPFEKICASRSG